jgi:hypothetical protein
MLSFFQNHVVAGIALLIGPTIAIGALILHAYALREMGLPLEVWDAIGLGIFVLGIIGILIKWDKEHQQFLRYDAAAIVASPIVEEDDRSILRLTLNQKRALLDEVARLRTLISSILIAFTNGDRATEQLAHDFGEVFTRSGISPWYVYARPDSRSQSGVILCIEDLNDPPPATEDLKGALRSAKIAFEVSGFSRSGFSGSSSPDGVNKNLVLWVAPNPL